MKSSMLNASIQIMLAQLKELVQIENFDEAIMIEVDETRELVLNERIIGRSLEVAQAFDGIIDNFNARPEAILFGLGRMIARYAASLCREIDAEGNIDLDQAKFLSTLATSIGLQMFETESSIDLDEYSVDEYDEDSPEYLNLDDPDLEDDDLESLEEHDPSLTGEVLPPETPTNPSGLRSLGLFESKKPVNLDAPGHTDLMITPEEIDKAQEELPKAPIAFEIHKTSRAPTGTSYAGSTWDTAGIRDRYRPSYESQEEALALAKLLTEHNPVGFSVEPIYAKDIES